MRRKGLARTILGRVGIALAILGALGLALELRTFRLQSELLAAAGQAFHHVVASGANPALRFPAAGPYDARLGYSRIPAFVERLGERGYEVELQAIMSPALDRFVALGGFAPYREKSRAGLTLYGSQGEPILRQRYPERAYGSFAEIPPLLVESLLFIENRELLDSGRPARNPAVEWDRLARVTVGRALSFMGAGPQPGGGSTLATQIEKFRHSPGGRTDGVAEKLRQIASASARAYLDGPDTVETRRRIVADYLNATPLGGRAGYGEVNGLAEGLRVWYGRDFDAVNQALAAEDAATLSARAEAYKQALSLLLAQRRPQHYLSEDRPALGRLTDRYLRLLAGAGVISPYLRDAALETPLAFSATPPRRSEPASFVAQKARNAVRAEVMALIGEANPYALARLDLSVESSLDAAVQERVTEILASLGDPKTVRRLGLAGRRLLGRGDPAKVVYSFTLTERGPDANRVRVRADTLDRPFDLNAGAKLDLGSTAKLRTLITYLEIVHRLHGWYAGRDATELDAIALDRPDALTLWAVRHLANTRDRSLPSMLEAALQRRYAASPRERFFTGGGVHEFENFDGRHDGQVFSIAESFRHSVNLPFVRLMRDIVAFEIAEAGRGQAVLAETDHAGRRAYLARYADQDGKVYLDRFHRAYRDKDADAVLETLASKLRTTPKRLAVVYRSLRPEAPLEAFAAFLAQQLGGRAPSAEQAARLYDEHAPGRFSLVDRGYIAGVHPLELWLAAYLQRHPQATRGEIRAASRTERQEVMAWLTESGRHQKQNPRIWTVLEQEAFARIHRGWRRLGYPFDDLVPSFATAIGSSADRPEALSRLMGIILNDGLALPDRLIERLRFAEGTPYETVMTPRPTRPKRVLAPEIARVLRGLLNDVVENGTARRAKTAFTRPDGERLRVGGKTGTGDNRFKTFASGGKLVDERVVNRTATFVFFIDERFFGTVTAYVDGPEAADYGFTSSLPAQLLKTLAPALAPLLEGSGAQTADAAKQG